MPRDNDNNKSRGKPPRRGAGRPGAGGGRSRDDKGGGGKRFGEKRPFAGKRSFGDRPSGDRPSGDRSGGERPFRGKPGGFRKDRDDAPRGEGRGFRKDFKPRDRDGGGERKPWSKDRPQGGRSFEGRGDRAPRGDRPPRRDYESRGSERPHFNRDDKPRFSRGGDDKPRFNRDRSEGRSERPRFNRDRDDRAPRGDRPPRRDYESRGSDRPRGERSERPRFSRDDKPRFSRGGEDKPRFNRDRGEGRSERPRFDRPRQDRSRDDRAPRGDRPPRREWQDHPRSEGGFRGRDGDSRPPRRDFRRDGERSEGRSEGRRFERNRDDRARFNREDRGERAPPREGPPASKTGERIAKVVARAGMCSRRDAETWITEGRVAVNGRVITSPALDVVPSDVITIDGEKLPEREPTRLFLHHKPRGLVTTHSDPEERPTVFENLPKDLPRVISVGRLDFNTEGLLLLTNDGALARALELPANGWLRRYRVRAHGEVTQEQLDALKDGIEIDGVRYGAIAATLDRDQGANVWITFEIREGKNREVRNVLAHLGLEVNRLIRTSYGPFQLGELPEGAVEEVASSTLREQLGEKIAAIAGFNKGGGETKPKQRRSGLIADRKGRRVLVERSADAPRRGDDDDGGDDFPPRRPPQRRYHGKRT